MYYEEFAHNLGNHIYTKLTHECPYQYYLQKSELGGALCPYRLKSG